MSQQILLQQISDLSKELKIKYDLLSENFEKKFGLRPEFFARAPGRVNLIGNKIFYINLNLILVIRRTY